MISKKSTAGRSGTKNGSRNRAETPDTQAQPTFSLFEEFLGLCPNGSFLGICRNGSPEEIAEAIAKGAELNAQDSDGRTPLICAAFLNRNPDVLLALLEAGADVNLTDSEGRRAIDYARKNKKFEGTDALQILERASSI